MIWPTKAGCLCARMSRGFNGQDAVGLLVVLSSSESANINRGGVASTLMARNYKSATDIAVETEENEKPKRKYIVRRLTPTECARLQGFPDWWCDGADGSDSAQYKLWGNGIALPCATDLLRRIAKELRKNDEQSLD